MVRLSPQSRNFAPEMTRDTNNKILTVPYSDKILQGKLSLLLRTGCMLVESSADTSRILRNMKRTAAFLGLEEDLLHIYVNFDMLMVNYSDKEHSFTKFQRCSKHGVDMAAISALSKLSWRAIRENYSTDEYEKQLDSIANRKRNYTPWQVAVGGGFACGGFCIQFGCDWPAFFYASAAAILGFRLRMYLNSKGFNAYMNIGIAAFVATILAWLTSFLSLNPTMSATLPFFMHSSTPWHPLMACALFIVPGVPLINFVSDMLDGHIQIGITRAVRTLMIILAMAFGIALAIKVGGIDNFVRNLSMTPHHNYISYAIAAAVSAMGFSMIFNTPRRLLWGVAIGGIIAVCIRNLVSLGPSTNNMGLDLGPTIGSLVGSTVTSIIATRSMHWLHTPHHCISIPSVIPMIPGVLMYRALFAFINMHGIVGEVTVAMSNAIKASLIILCIAIGVAIPNTFFRRMIAPKRKKKLFHLLVSRRKRSKTTEKSAIPLQENCSCFDKTECSLR